MKDYLGKIFGIDDVVGSAAGPPVEQLRPEGRRAGARPLRHWKKIAMERVLTKIGRARTRHDGFSQLFKPTSLVNSRAGLEGRKPTDKISGRGT